MAGGGQDARLREPLLGEQRSSQSGAAKQAKPSTLLTVCPYILSNEFCERLAYYGLATNLVTYITEMIGGNPGFAAIMVAVFEGACYTTPLIGAVFADSMWGRYKTILVFSMIYLVGIFMLTLSSWPPMGAMPAPDEEPGWWAYTMLCGSLAIIALGTGGIKPNVSSFGADQFNLADPQDRREKESFFNYFYMAINVGSLIACTAIVYVQDQVSWTLGFAIPGMAMLLAIVVFVMGSSVYVHVLPTESPMVRVVKVVYAAMQNRWKKKHSADQEALTAHDVSSLHGSQAYAHAVASSGAADKGMGARGRVQAGGEQDDSRLQVPMNVSSSYRWLEDAITEWQTSQGQHMHVGGLAGYTPKQVEEVKLVLRLLPVFFSSILYWTIYTQMSSMFVNQGNVMQRQLVWNGSVMRVPSASMAVFNTVSIIVLIYVYDKGLEPLLRRMGYRMTLLRRIGWGMVVAAFAMANAALVEHWRLQVYRQEYCSPALCEGGVGGGVGPGSKGCCQPGTPDLSIFWQAPQYVLVGLSEVLTSIAQIEFFYDQAPDVMRSCSMALGLLSSALGSYMAGMLTWLVQVYSEKLTGQQWLPNDLNLGRLDLFFLFMMVLMVVNTAAFVMVAIRYEYKQVEHKATASPAMAGATADGPAAQRRNGPARPRTTAPLGIPTPHAGGPSSSSAVAIRGMPRAHGVPGVEGASAEDEEALMSMEVYARSLAYQPDTPVMPAPFR